MYKYWQEDLNNFLNMMSIGEALFKSKADIWDKHAELLVLYEEKLELQLVKAFKNSKKDVLSKLSILDKYINKKFLNKYLPEIIEYPLEPRYKFNQVGNTRFKEYTFSVEIRDWLIKSGINDDIASIVNINPDPFKQPITDAKFKSYVSGGQTAFNIFDLGIDFALRDKNVEKYYENYAIKLSQQVAKELQTKIKFEILEGIKSAESIPEIRNRILNVYNKPIDIVVKPKLGGDGNIIRQGYSYQMSPTNWATTVARTEVAQAYTEGRLEGFRIGGVVDKVEYSVTPDERLCPICAPFEGRVFKLEDAGGIIPQHAQCLVHPNSPIYTADGWKKIADIKVNDLVLTHKGRFKKVIQLHRNKYDGKIVKLFFGKKRILDKTSISITANHPLLINGRWIEADKVKIGDKAKILVHHCENCNYKFQDIEITDIRHYNKKVATYNLSVEDDESYVYNGIAVHNCRCQFIPLISKGFGEAKEEFKNNVIDAYNLKTGYEFGKTNTTIVDEYASDILERLELTPGTKEATDKLGQIQKAVDDFFGKRVSAGDLQKAYGIDIEGYSIKLDRYNMTRRLIRLYENPNNDKIFVIHGNILDNDGKVIGDIERRMKRNMMTKKLDVDHAYFSLNKLHQGKGIARSLLKNSISFYDYLGVDSAELLADLSVGKYAWAKYGFDFKDAADLNSYRNLYWTKLKFETVEKLFPSNVMNSVQSGKLWKLISDDIEKKLKTFKHSWDFALYKEQIKIGDKIIEISGKDIMLHMPNWQGSLNLDKNSLSRKIFDNYIERK